MAKESIIEMKKELTIWKNIFASDTSDKGLISKISLQKPKWGHKFSFILGFLNTQVPP